MQGSGQRLKLLCNNNKARLPLLQHIKDCCLIAMWRHALNLQLVLLYNGTLFHLSQPTKSPQDISSSCQFAYKNMGPSILGTSRPKNNIDGRIQPVFLFQPVSNHELCRLLCQVQELELRWKQAYEVRVKILSVAKWPHTPPNCINNGG